MKLNKIKLAMMIFNIWNNTNRNDSLEQWITHHLSLDDEFECKIRDGMFSYRTNFMHLKLLLDNGVIELVRKAKGGQGVKEGAIYRFNPTFKELCTNKRDLLDALEGIL